MVGPRPVQVLTMAASIQANQTFDSDHDRFVVSAAVG